jgi:hypothetical protein
MAGFMNFDRGGGDAVEVKQLVTVLPSGLIIDPPN